MCDRPECPVHAGNGVWWDGNLDHAALVDTYCACGNQLEPTRVWPDGFWSGSHPVNRDWRKRTCTTCGDTLRESDLEARRMFFVDGDFCESCLAKGDERI